MTYFSISTIDAKESFTDLINQVSHHKERIILARRDKEIAALIPIEDLRLLQSIENKNDLEEAISSLKEVRTQGSMTLEDLKNQIGS